MNEQLPATSTEEQPAVPTKPRSNTRLWWGILLVYVLLVVTTGYLALVNHDANPALTMNRDTLAARLADSSTREFMIATFQQETADHQKKSDLAAQSFDVVLGALLGFLSASAVSRITAKDERE